jgi:hypothetical protein
MPTTCHTILTVICRGYQNMLKKPPSPPPDGAQMLERVPKCSGLLSGFQSEVRNLGRRLGSRVHGWCRYVETKLENGKLRVREGKGAVIAEKP